MIEPTLTIAAKHYKKSEEKKSDNDDFSTDDKNDDKPQYKRTRGQKQRDS